MKPKKHNTHKDILFILFSSFIVVVAWIGFNLYHIWVTSTISEELQVQLTSIDGSFDMKTLQKLKTRERVNPAFERQGVPVQPTAAAPTGITQPTPSVSTLPEPTVAVTGQPKS
jgi:hypothetical protein